MQGLHLHVGVLHALSIFASVVVVGFFWRVVAGHLHDSALGQAMAFIY
jgi:hypothetical protein